MSFNAEDDIALVENVKINQALYDINHESYNDSAFKGVLWIEISMKIGKTVKQCKKRWKNIKSAHSKTKNQLDSEINNISTSLNLKFLDEIPTKKTEIVQDGENEIATDIRDNSEIEIQFLVCDNGDLDLEKSDTQYSYTNGESKEDKIANVLASSLKERNLMLYHNLEKQIELLNTKGHFTVTITHNDETTSNNDNIQTKQTTPKLSLENLSPYIGENVDLSKEKKSVVYNLVNQINEANTKSETIDSLNLFFESVSIDMEDFSPIAINEVKLRILKCVSEIRKTNYDLNILPDASSTIAQPEQGDPNEAHTNKGHQNGKQSNEVRLSTGHSNEAHPNEEHPNEENPTEERPTEEYPNEEYPNEEHAGESQPNENNETSNGMQTSIAMCNGKSETVKSLDLFFKSVAVDMKDFCTRAIDDVKIQILTCVSDVRGLYLYERHAPVMSTNTYMPNDPSNTALVPVGTIIPPPPHGHRYVTYYNYPYYCTGQPYTQTFY